MFTVVDEAHRRNPKKKDHESIRHGENSPAFRATDRRLPQASSSIVNEEETTEPTYKSFQPLTCLCEKNPSRNSVDWHTQHVAKPIQPMQGDQFTYRGRVISSEYHSTYFSIADPVFPPDSGNALKTSMVKHCKSFEVFGARQSSY
ncbi:hypothetical protein T265_11363 [Opisthorchis viverrini]|uniref:Uncharacterized protein n=1 Tax=Opisthorchis viverrini TaxID=6198 RepID=A0A074YYX5_OPIVI|nr:hypothetical protein T265_11363 [Opisthorchis viverrini]KER19996.1 hypothetical protein T265_11363 [Opisthorchis viverrini]